MTTDEAFDQRIEVALDIPSGSPARVENARSRVTRDCRPALAEPDHHKNWSLPEAVDGAVAAGVPAIGAVAPAGRRGRRRERRPPPRARPASALSSLCRGGFFTGADDCARRSNTRTTVARSMRPRP